MIDRPGTPRADLDAIARFVGYALEDGCSPRAIRFVVERALCRRRLAEVRRNAKEAAL